MDAGFEARDVREAVAAGAATRIAVANYIFGKDSPERPWSKFGRGLAVLQGRAVPGLLGLCEPGAARTPQEQ